MPRFDLMYYIVAQSVRGDNCGSIHIYTENCIYHIYFYKNDVLWTNISISIRAAADNRLR